MYIINFVFGNYNATNAIKLAVNMYIESCLALSEPLKPQVGLNACSRQQQTPLQIVKKYATRLAATVHADADPAQRDAAQPGGPPCS